MVSPYDPNVISKEETECEDRKYKNKKTAKIMSYYKK